MMRNDYRRALILLRSSASGYSGHVRLERRTMMGSMYFLVQAPQDGPVLRASLAGRDKRGDFACDLGELSRDSRGQATLSVNFDPRNICGRSLEDYRLILISCADEPACEILLQGNVDGHTDMDREGLRRALCAIYARENPQESPAQQNIPAAEAPAQTAPQEAPPEPEMPNVRETEAAVPEEIQDAPEASENEVPEFFAAGKGAAAAERLDLDIGLPWPESVESLRLLFIHSPLLENPPDDEFVYIAAPMPEESGYAYCAVGILVRDGAPAAVRYGLPALWSARQPAGLDEYSWVGDGNRGWWMTELQL